LPGKQVKQIALLIAELEYVEYFPAGQGSQLMIDVACVAVELVPGGQSIKLERSGQ
jgi:hypothetical protein